MRSDIDSQAHLNSLGLLGEVADYLGRLPAHPMHSQMKRRIEEHLGNPEAKALEKRLTADALDKEYAARIASGVVFSGGGVGYSEEGLPLLLVSFAYPKLRIESPAVSEYHKGEEHKKLQASLSRIGSELAAGIELAMSLKTAAS